MRIDSIERGAAPAIQSYGAYAEKKGGNMKRAVLLSVMGVVLVGVFTLAGMTQGTTAPAAGEQLFKDNCMSCHAGGGNILDKEMPLTGSPDLKTFAAFLTQIRKPKAPMPPFPASKISDTQARRLYDYILKQEENGWK
jgi:cytochrome c6